MKKHFLIISLLCSTHFIQPMEGSFEPEKKYPLENNIFHNFKNRDFVWDKILQGWMLCGSFKDGYFTTASIADASGVKSPKPLWDLFPVQDNHQTQHLPPQQHLPPITSLATLRIALKHIGKQSVQDFPTHLGKTSFIYATNTAIKYTGTDQKLPAWMNPDVVGAMLGSAFYQHIPSITNKLTSTSQPQTMHHLSLKSTLKESTQAGVSEYLTKGMFKVFRKVGLGKYFNEENPLVYVAVDTAMNSAVHAATPRVISEAKRKFSPNKGYGDNFEQE